MLQMLQVITILSVVGVMGIVLIVAFARPGQDATQNVILLLGFLSPTLVSLVALLKSSENKEKIQDIHTALVANNIDTPNGN